MNNRPAAGAELYVVYLGGEPAPGRLGEDHEVVVVVANSLQEARAAARAKWRGESKGHVDAVQALRVVDGYEVRLVPTVLADDVELDVTYEPDPDSAGAT
jgi:hypothetical protein